MRLDHGDLVHRNQCAHCQWNQVGSRAVGSWSSARRRWCQQFRSRIRQGNGERGCALALVVTMPAWPAFVVGSCGFSLTLDVTFPVLKRMVAGAEISDLVDGRGGDGMVSTSRALFTSNRWCANHQHQPAISISGKKLEFFSIAIRRQRARAHSKRANQLRLGLFVGSWFYDGRHTLTLRFTCCNCD